MNYFIDTPTHPLPASTPETVVEYFRKTSKTGSHLPLPAYMLYLAQAFTDFSGGLLLRTDSPDNLIGDLITYGWLSVV